MLKVRLIAHTPEPEKLVAAAAKICYSPSGADEIMEGLSPEKVDGFLRMLTDMGHESPIEHASFTFAAEGVSRSLLAQLTRHRIASFSVQSQRYVRGREPSFITPPEIAADKAAAEIYEASMRRAWEDYGRLAELLFERHLRELTEAGEDERSARKKAEKAAIEDARFVLPNACETKLVMTMNARSLHNFFRLRCCMRAQWEIRELAWQMLEQCRAAAPGLFAKAGPSCAYGACSEGKMSCGRAAEVRRRCGNV